MRRAEIISLVAVLFLSLGLYGCSGPDNANEYLMRGMQNAASGDLLSAIEDFTEAINLEPQNTALYVARASVYDSNGDYQSAIDDYEMAIELNPNLEAGLERQLNYLRDKAS